MKAVLPDAAFRQTILVRFRDCDPAGFTWKWISLVPPVRRVGQSSIHGEIVLTGRDEVERVRGKLVLVLTDLRAHQSMEIPEGLPARLLPYLCE